MKVTNQNMMEKGRKKIAPSKSIRVPKKTKKLGKKPRSPSLLFQEELESQIVMEVQEDDTLKHEEEETAATMEPTPT